MAHEYYTVKSGDTLWDIAKSKCGNALLWKKIWYDNYGVIGNDPNKIYPGQVLSITCPGAPSCKYVYTVEYGDTLSGIALRHCGSADYTQIYNDNKHVIGDDPNKIFPGQVLCINC